MKTIAVSLDNQLPYLTQPQPHSFVQLAVQYVLQTKIAQFATQDIYLKIIHVSFVHKLAKPAK